VALKRREDTMIPKERIINGIYNKQNVFLISGSADEEMKSLVDVMKDDTTNFGNFLFVEAEDLEFGAISKLIKKGRREKAKVKGLHDFLNLLREIDQQGCHVVIVVPKAEAFVRMDLIERSQWRSVVDSRGVSVLTTGTEEQLEELFRADIGSPLGNVFLVVKQK